jgi:hypothetical protein
MGFGAWIATLHTSAEAPFPRDSVSITQLDCRKIEVPKDEKCAASLLFKRNLDASGTRR